MTLQIVELELEEFQTEIACKTDKCVDDEVKFPQLLLQSHLAT